MSRRSSLLIESCKRYGLIVIGYSGRDASVMRTLEEAIDGGKGYPNGLFWLHRPHAPVLSDVTGLITRARDAGVQAKLIEADAFDEVLGDVIKHWNEIPADISERLEERRSIITGFHFRRRKVVGPSFG